jgi:hypothetical protein
MLRALSPRFTTSVEIPEFCFFFREIFFDVIYCVPLNNKYPERASTEAQEEHLTAIFTCSTIKRWCRLPNGRCEVGKLATTLLVTGEDHSEDWRK